MDFVVDRIQSSVSNYGIEIYTIISVICTVLIGVAVFFHPLLLLSVVGHIALSTYNIYSEFKKKEFTWTLLMKEIAKHAALGAVSALFSFGAFAAISHLGIDSYFAVMAIYAVAGVVTNTFDLCMDVVKGKQICTKEALLKCVGFGVLSGVLAGVFVREINARFVPSTNMQTLALKIVKIIVKDVLIGIYNNFLKNWWQKEREEIDSPPDISFDPHNGPSPDDSDGNDMDNNDNGSSGGRGGNDETDSHQMPDMDDLNLNDNQPLPLNTDTEIDTNIERPQSNNPIDETPINNSSRSYYPGDGGSGRSRSSQVSNTIHTTVNERDAVRRENLTNLKDELELIEAIHKMKEKKDFIGTKKEQKEEMIIITSQGSTAAACTSSESPKRSRHNNSSNSKPFHKENDENDDADVFIKKKVSNEKRRLENSFASPSKLETTSTKQKKIKVAEVLPLIQWNTTEKKYTLSRENWPRNVNGKVLFQDDNVIESDNLKIVAIAGLSGTGKTLLVHSLVYAYGYEINVNLAVASYQRLGAMMYVLREDGLIIIDVCDSIDTGNENPLMANYLIELFSFINCDCMFFSIPFYNEVNVSEIYENVKERLKCLLISAWHEGHQVMPLICIVPRVIQENMNQETNKKLKKLDGMFQQDFYKLKANQIPDSKGNIKPLDNNLEATDLDVLMSRVLVVSPLTYFRENRKNFKYMQSLDHLRSKIIGKINTYKKESGKEELYNKWEKLWGKLENSTELGNILTECANEEIQKQCMNQKVPQNFFENLKAFGEKCSQNYKDIVKEINRLLENRNAFSEKFKDIKIKYEEEKQEKANEEKSEETLAALQSLFPEIAKVLLTECVKIKESELKIMGLELGLNALSMIPIEEAICKYKVLKLLSKPLIYLHFSGCWQLLHQFASQGYRRYLLEFPIWEAIEEVLKADKNIEEKENKEIYKYLFKFLIALMNTIELSLKKQELGGSLKKDAKPSLTEKQLQILNNDFFMKCETLIMSFLTKNLETPADVLNKEKLHNAIKNFYENHSIRKEANIAFDNVNAASFDQLYFIALNHYAKYFAFHFASKIMEQTTVNNIKKKTYSVMPIEIKILILQVFTTAINALDNTDSFEKIFNSGLFTWVLEHLNSSPIQDQEIYPSFLKLAAMFISSEMYNNNEAKAKIFDKCSAQSNTTDRKVHDMIWLQNRDASRDRVKHYGYYRLKILNTCPDGKTLCNVVALDYFIKTVNDTHKSSRFPLKKLQNCLSFLSCFFFKNYKEDTYVDPVLKRRKPLIASLKTIIDAVSDIEYRIATREKNLATIQYIQMCLLILNRLFLCWNQNVEDLKNIYRTESSSNRDTELFTLFVDIMKRVFYKLYRAWLDNKRRLKEETKKLPMAETRLAEVEEYITHIESKLDPFMKDFLCFCYNVSITCEISMTKVFSEKKGELDHEPEPEILITDEKFSKLSIDNKASWDYKNFCRVSYIISGNLRGTEEQEKVTTDIMECLKMQVKTMEENLKFMEANKKALETARKHYVLADKDIIRDTWAGINDKPKHEILITDSFTLSVSEALQPLHPLAIENVCIKTSLLDIAVPKIPNIAFEIIRNNLDGDDLKAHVLALLLWNNGESGCEKLITLYQQMDFKKTIEMKDLKWIETALPYWEGLDDENQKEFCETLREYLRKAADYNYFIPMLDTSFKQGTEPECNFFDQRLPKDFFKTTDAEDLEKLSIKKLTQTKNAKEVTNYILIAVQKQNYFYQAVFNKVMDLSSVKQSLRAAGVEFEQLAIKKENTEELLTKDEVQLQQLGTFAIYLQAR